MDDAFTWMGRVRFAAKDYIWRQNDYRSMIAFRKKEAATCSVVGAVAASIKLIDSLHKSSFTKQIHV